jgi:hypothetical protein
MGRDKTKVYMTSKDYNKNENISLTTTHPLGIRLKRLCEMCDEVNMSCISDKKGIYLYDKYNNGIRYTNRRKAYAQLYYLIKNKIL